MVKSDRNIYTKLKTDIVNGYMAGDEEINLVSLERLYKVSKTSLREGFIQLAAEDLIDFIPGKGFFTKIYNPIEVSGTLHLYFMLIADFQAYITELDQNFVSAYLQDIEFEWQKKFSHRDLFHQITIINTVFDRVYRSPHNRIISSLSFKAIRFMDVFLRISKKSQSINFPHYLATILGNKNLYSEETIAIVEQDIVPFAEMISIHFNLENRSARSATIA